MELYNLLIGEDYGPNKIRKGRIWCTDGTFMEPNLEFRKSCKVPYGYALDEHRVARILRGSILRRWSSKYTELYSRLDLHSRSNGFMNSFMVKSEEAFSFFNCPAVYESCTQVNAGVTSYMPAIDELWMLYDVVKSGRLKQDLANAGVMGSCNYINDSEDFLSGWGSVWSSTESGVNGRCALMLHNGGIEEVTDKSIEGGYIIQFFKF